jgi:hypothetical protein
MFIRLSQVALLSILAWALGKAALKRPFAVIFVMGWTLASLTASWCQNGDLLIHRTDGSVRHEN